MSDEPQKLSDQRPPAFSAENQPIPAAPSGTPQEGTQDANQEKANQELLDAAYLAGVSDGTIPFSPVRGNHSVKLSDYAFALAGHLSGTLGMERKKVITLALIHYARSITASPIVNQHDVAMLTQGMQLTLQDLSQEVAELSMLAISVAEQEETAGRVEN